MTLADLFSPCWFGHEEPIKVRTKGELHFECGRCGSDLGVVLPHQCYRMRVQATVPPVKDLVAIQEREQRLAQMKKPAAVISMAKRKVG